jgi:beta-lactamase class A
MRYNKFINFFILIAVVAGTTYFFTAKYFKKKEGQDFGRVQSIREKDSPYKFINPLLAYDLPESKDFGEFIDLNKKLTDLISLEKNQHRVEDVSIYFRGDQGRWVGINDTGKYYPASLLKVVVMMAYYQQAQQDPGILAKQLQYTSQIQNQVTNSEFNVPSTLKLNQTYKVDDLIRSMIVDSDNGATFVLLNSLDGKSLDEVYSDFGLPGPSDDNYEISSKDYSLFFRILYNATYLNREYSEKALTLLSQTTYKNGLVAGLPVNTTIAHKFGEHILTDDKGTQTGIELHDCGLVYGQHQFLLCVMTRGQNVENLEQTIKDITNLVYKELN